MTLTFVQLQTEVNMCSKKKENHSGRVYIKDPDQGSILKETNIKLRSEGWVRLSGLSLKKDFYQRVSILAC